jgi:hypothetical protein
VLRGRVLVCSATPLWIATANGHVAVAHTLLVAGADPLACTTDAAGPGVSAVDVAFAVGDRALTAMLLAAAHRQRAPSHSQPVSVSVSVPMSVSMSAMFSPWGFAVGDPHLAAQLLHTPWMQK